MQGEQGAVGVVLPLPGARTCQRGAKGRKRRWEEEKVKEKEG